MPPDEPIPIQKKDEPFPMKPESRATPSDAGRKLYADAAPGVYRIRTDRGGGTGFLTVDNQIITNYHVINNAQHIFAVDSEGTMFRVKPVAIDDIADLAALKFVRYEPEVKKPLQIDWTSEPQKGDKAYIIGNPNFRNPPYLSEGKLLSTTTEGNVVAKTDPGQRKAVADSLKALSADERKEATTFLERPIYAFDAIVRPGNSGSPVLNADGNVSAVVHSNFNSKGEPVEAYSTTTADLRSFLRNEHQRFRFDDIYVGEDWAERYKKNWGERPWFMAGSTTLAVGGSGVYMWRNATRAHGGRLLPLAIGGYASMNLLEDVAVLTQTNQTRDHLKYGAGSAADLATIVGAATRIVGRDPRTRGIGMAVAGASLISRWALDFLPTEYKNTSITRIDGVNRPPFDSGKFLDYKPPPLPGSEPELGIDLRPPWHNPETPETPNPERENPETPQPDKPELEADKNRKPKK